MEARAPHVPVIDGFRAYAVLGIVLLHVLGLAGVFVADHGEAFQVLVWGTVGNVIDVFFIISGFVLFLPVIARGGDLGGVRSFYIRRAARIYPAYWLSLAVLLALMAIELPPFTVFPPLSDIAVQFAGLALPAQLVDGSFQIGFGVNGVLWFVSLILGFYLLFPLVAGAYFRHPLIGLATAAAISVGWKEAAAHLTGGFQTLEGHTTDAFITQLLVVPQLPGWVFSLGVGMTAAWAYTRLTQSRPREQLERIALRAAPLALLALAGSIYLFGHKAGLADAIAPTVARTSAFIPIAYSSSLAAVILVVLLGPPLLQRPFVNEPVRRLAELSYGIFLIHAVVGTYLGVMVLHLPNHGTLADVALCFVVVLAVSSLYAYISLRFVERPVRAWARRFIVPAPPPSRPAALESPASLPANAAAPLAPGSAVQR
jgi:peptidoglycan/LPS O-acetylase OafA/YrhL